MTTTSLPTAFVARMRERLGPELEAFLDALAAPEAGLRVNTLRLDPAGFERIAPFAIEPLGILAEGFEVVDDDAAPGRHPYQAAGLYYLQDPGAMLVGALVDPRPGERILDLAAAPGGKATHLAARMRGRGVLIANDVSRSRARELAGNLERCGVRNAIVMAAAPDRLAARLGPTFDRVLLDAPCSGESMFHRTDAARDDWSEAVVAGCARRQSAILAAAAELVAPGGALVYSTCTFAAEENEYLIRDFLDRRHDFAPAGLPPLHGAEPVALAGEERAGACYLWPHRLPGAGHFVAALRREGGGGAPRRAPERRRETDGVESFREFVADVLPAMDFGWERIARFGDRLYELPPGAPELGGLGVLEPGAWLGTVRRGRFEPAHALALATRHAEAGPQIDLDLEDDRVAAYLAGETLEGPGAPGWLAVRVDGFALGWGKRTGRIIKNHYPKGLRRRRRQGSQ